MGDLNYNHLRYFWAVAQDGNLTRTAERLNVSQSALSVQIRKLEDRIGHPLFERRGRQLHLTEAGRITLDHASAIFAIGDQLLGTLRETGMARQAVHVGALATLSRNFQLSFLRPILGRSDIEVISRSGSPAELLLGLRSLALDVVLTNMVPSTEDLSPLIAHKLYEQPVSLIGVPAPAPAKRTIADLIASHPVILPTRESGVRSAFDAMMERMRLRPSIAAEVDDMAMMRLLVRQGFALAVLPPIVVEDELASGTLIELNTLSGIAETFFAVTVRRRFPNAVVHGLINAAKSTSGL